MRNPWK
jgi:hypothetical protein